MGRGGLQPCAPDGCRPIQGGRTGWRVLNDSDQPVTNVVVRSTTGAKIQVYNNDLTQLSE